MKLATLRKRREFLRVRGGGRWSTHAFVLETKARPTLSEAGQTSEHVSEIVEPCSRDDGGEARFGLTVTKRLGNAVRRNRIRRRLRAVLTAVAPERARAAFDYVIIARDAAHDMQYAELARLMSTALERVHQKPATAARKPSGRGRERADGHPQKAAPRAAPRTGKNTGSNDGPKTAATPPKRSKNRD